MESEERPPKLRKLDDETDGCTAYRSDASLEVVAVDRTTDRVHIQTSERINHTNSTSPLPTSQAPPRNLEPSVQTSIASSVVPEVNSVPSETPAPSKSRLKKLRKKEAWEAGRDQRKILRKQKNQEKKARIRAQRVSLPRERQDEANSTTSLRPGVPKRTSGTLLPITLIIDCAFDDLMHERERISLASQITRAYSDNYRAPYKTHLVLSSWGGELRARFDTTLSQHYKKWKGVTILEDDFEEAAVRSKERMTGPDGGQLASVFAVDSNSLSTTQIKDQGEIIYLTSDSDNTLERLKPYSTYIIGGLVDKNRHKGVCYKRACDRKIKAAKLPIGDYMNMQSRYVLTTNHVVEIMIRWLECGEWGEAFLKVMPKRKGGKLKNQSEAHDAEDEHKEEENPADGSEASGGLDGEEGCPEANVMTEDSSRPHPGQNSTGEDGRPEVSTPLVSIQTSTHEDKHNE